MGGACSVNGEEEKRTQGFGGETRGEKTLRRPWRRCQNNIKMYFKQMGWGVWNMSNWFRTGTVVVRLEMRQ